MFCYVCRVKAITFVLALFFLGLSLAPCSDAAIQESDIAMVVNGDTQSDHDTSSDLCSPLCVCHCCHSHLVVQQIELSNFDELLFPVQKISYKEPVTEGFLGAILQPPQV